MRTINEILDRLYKELGIKNDAEFCRKYGIKKNTLSTWKARNKIPYDLIDEITQNENLSLDWILQGRNNIQNKKIEVKYIEPKNTENKIDIPYYPETYAAAGAGAYNYEEAPKVISFTKAFLEELLELTKFTGLHIINAIGDSMSPTIESGDKLFILPFEIENHQIREGGIYIISCNNGVLVKRIYLNPFEGKITLKSDNTEIPDIIIAGDELNGCQIIGRVVGSIKKF